MKDIIIVIPAYEPDDALVSLIERLRQSFDKFIVVDDGSKTADATFARVAEMPDVTLLKHEVNRGKGAALKTAFAKVLSDFPEAAGVVTVDADGQHLPEDVANVAKATKENPGRYTLGVRAFSGNVPLRSRFGNAWSRYFFFLLTGVMVYDTQTGLRGMPRDLLPELIAMPGDRYEYEMRMLVAAARKKLKPVQIPIKTVYLNDNKASHFNPIRDSIRTQVTLLQAVFTTPRGK
jgi:glycosyltransferase involved in cell wall biosynthesis